MNIYAIKAIISMAGQFAGRAAQLSSMLIVIPLVASHLSSTEMSVYFLCVGLFGMSALFDGGIGFAALNAISKRESREYQSAIFKSAIKRVVIVVFFVFIIFAFLLFIVDFRRFLHIGDGEAHSIYHVLWTQLIFFCISIFSSFFGRILLGLHVGFWSSILEVFGHFLGLIILLLMVSKSEPTLEGVIIVAGTPYLISAIFGYYLVRTKIGWSKHESTKLLYLGRDGMRYLCVQASVLMSFAPDQWILSNAIGVEGSGAFAALSRLQGISIVIQSLSLGSWWPYLSRAYEQGDKETIASVINKMLLMSLLLGIAQLCIIGFFGDKIVYWWTQNSVNNCNLPLWKMGLLTLAVILTVPIGLIVNVFPTSRGIIIQAAIAIIFIPLFKYLGAVNAGMDGMLTMALIFYLICMTIPLVYLFQRHPIAVGKT